MRGASVAWTALLLALMFPRLLCAQTATVTDGDTLKLNGTTYRLWGIDAPESKQACPDGWAAGKEATGLMRDLITGHAVECEPRGKDKYGRTIGLCRANGIDIQAAMVSAGMAWAFRRYSHDYVLREGEAQAANLGVHAHDCQPAWGWRARARGDQ